ncbi:interferon-induced very large GTPase 1-like, partial [Mercenaria mercenaria]|uniref:interferon-induced very large GTPase 1-like n=1 Tax=Mercenaria mercenaria TaxID=6596 RepID=UPI00234F4D3B
SCTCSSRPTKIKVTGLPENIDEEDLQNIFENKRRQGGGDVRHVQVFESQGTAIIEFEESEAVEIVLKKRPISIKKTKVSVYMFHSSNTVEVRNIPTDVSIESLKKYFEEQASDEDSITCIVMEADVAFVTFKNEQITKQIANKDRHTLENHRQPIVVNFHDPELVHTDQMNVTGSSDLNIDHGLQTFDEKKHHFKNLLERMGLLSRVDKLIAVTEVLSVHIVSTETQEVDERVYPWTFLHKLCTGNYKARDMCFALSDRDQSSNTSPLDNLDKESEERISPLDLFLAIYSCCDPMLKQLIFKNLYLCKLAVPFIFDQLCSSDQCPSVSVWPLRALLIESKIAQDGNTESEVLDLQSARVTFARFGRPSFSKSKVLNSLLSQGAYNTFYNFDCTYGTTKRNVSDGYVEMFWLPIVKNEKSNISSPLTFFNVRGDLQMYFCEHVLPFLSQITDIFVLVIEVQSLLQRFDEVQGIVKSYRYVLLIICGRLDPKDVHKVNSLKEFEASLKENNPKSIIHIVLTHECGIEKNMKQVANVISERIETFEKDIVKTTLKDRLSNIENKSVIIDETEQSCVEGKRIATDIIEAMGTQKDAPLLWKKRVTPVHSLYSRCLGENNMKIRREQDLARIEQLKYEMDNLRKEQINNITPAIKLFARYLVSKAESPSCLRFILAWLNIFIQLEKQKLLPQLIKENRTAWKKMGDIKSQSNPNSEYIEVQRETIKRTENQLQEASFNIELLFHEIGNIYDTIIILRKDSTSLELPSIRAIVEVCASLFVEGNTLELIDSEAFYMPQHWIGKVFERVSEIMGSPKVLTVSILGIQSSGKSTLLNTMFGSQFPTSVGRCTKGIQMKLLPLHIDNVFQNILVLDTEGLRAPDVSDEKYTFDNQMATMITGLGDITVMNVMGENPMPIRDILQVVIHAFLRLKLADPDIDLRKMCTFIHHNVSSVMALDKMRPSVSKLMEILDSVTKHAAEMESIPGVVEFNQMIQFDMTSQVWFLPNLLEGCPPRITCEYSSQAADIKSKLLQLAISDTEKSYGSLNDVLIHARDLWKGVLTEDFVFYFRNSEEIRAYNFLESKIMHWLSEMQCFCRKKCIETSQEVVQKCNEQQELEEAAEAANKLVFDDLHNKEIKVKEEIDKCFNENEFKNTICRWKDETTRRFEYTCMDLRNSIKKETERFRQKRSIEIFQNSNRAEHEDKLHEKSVKLAKLAKDMSVENVNKQFENIWQEFVKEIENKSQVPTSYRKQEDTAALLISSEIETIAREAIRLCLPSKVLHELLDTTIASTKLDLIIDMLTDMAEGEKFFPFTVYIESPSEYAETWITEQSKNHLPGCCSGIQDSESKKAMLETCNFNVQKPGQIHNCLAFNFACNRVEGKSCDDSTMHLFSEYRKYLPDWDIEPDMDMSENSEFWMWFVATYKQQLADYYGYNVSNIPESWSYISKSLALINLRNKYSLTCLKQPTKRSRQGCLPTSPFW